MDHSRTAVLRTQTEHIKSSSITLMNCFLLVRLYVEGIHRRLRREAFRRKRLLLFPLRKVHRWNLWRSSWRFRVSASMYNRESSKFVEICLGCENLLRIIHQGQHLKEAASAYLPALFPLSAGYRRRIWKIP